MNATQSINQILKQEVGTIRNTILILQRVYANKQTRPQIKMWLGDDCPLLPIFSQLSEADFDNIEIRQTDKQKERNFFGAYWVLCAMKKNAAQIAKNFSDRKSAKKAAAK